MCVSLRGQKLISDWEGERVERELTREREVRWGASYRDKDTEVTFESVKAKRKGFVSVSCKAVGEEENVEKRLESNQQGLKGCPRGASCGRQPSLWSTEFSVTRSPDLKRTTSITPGRFWGVDWLNRNLTHTPVDMKSKRPEKTMMDGWTDERWRALYHSVCSVSFHPPLTGVHCTHGFNRTGFLICSYLVEKMDWRWEAVCVCVYVWVGSTCLLASFAHQFINRPGIETLKD